MLRDDDDDIDIPSKFTNRVCMNGGALMGVGLHRHRVGEVLMKK